MNNSARRLRNGADAREIFVTIKRVNAPQRIGDEVRPIEKKKRKEKSEWG